MRYLLTLLIFVSSVWPTQAQRDVKPLCVEISREHPLIIMMAPHYIHLSPEAHGEHIADAWLNHYPDELKPYTVVHIEERLLDIAERMDHLRRRIKVLERYEIPLVVQIADPDNAYTMPLKYAEQLLQEFPCIKGINLAELRIEYYTSFGAELKYKIPADTAHLIDAIKLAARYGRFTSIQVQKLRWPHILADELQQTLLETMQEYHEYVLPQNEMIEPHTYARQTGVLGLWLSDVVDHFGMEPQAWFWSGCRFLAPGVCGPVKNGILDVPPRFYRAMILINAMTGGTVFSFEPWWDLWNESNSHVGREAIYPTLLEIIRNRLIPDKNEVLRKTRVAYQMSYAKTLAEFHDQINDIDPAAGEGRLSRAAYGLFWRDQNYEVIPDKDRYFFIPLLPWNAPERIRQRFDSVLKVGDLTTEAAYENHLNQFYPANNFGTAFVTEIGGATYVMQTCENMYQEQTYRVQVPQWVSRPKITVGTKTIDIRWEPVSGAKAYEVSVLKNPVENYAAFQFQPLTEVQKPHFSFARDTSTVVVGIRALGTPLVPLAGKVNFLDYHVFLKEKSPLRHVAEVAANGKITHRDLLDLSNDPRPKSQTLWPTFPSVKQEHLPAAKAIAATYDSLAQRFAAADWQGVTDLYDLNYRDANGYSREYVGRALKWYLYRNQHPNVNMQVREWDFSDYENNSVVRLKLWTLWHTVAVDDLPWGDHGLLRVPRHKDEEVWFTWKKDAAGFWKILSTNPALPNFNEILWYNRGYETPKTLVPSID